MDTGLLGHFGSCEYAAMNMGVEIAETLQPVFGSVLGSGIAG